MDRNIRQRLKLLLKEVSFNLTLKNNGAVEVSLTGSVAIRNWRGEELFSEPIVLGNKLLAGSYRALSPTVRLRDSVSLPGLYQAQIRINYGLTNQTSSAIEHVWYFPLWSRIGALVVLGVLLALIFLKIKRKK